MKVLFLIRNLISKRKWWFVGAFLFLFTFYMFSLYVPIQYENKIISTLIPSKIYRKNEQLFEIKRGESVLKIISILKRNDLIRGYFPYGILYRFSSFKAGEYLLSDQMSAARIFNKIIKGKVFYHEVTLVEGVNIFQIADVLSEKGLANREDFLKTSEDSHFIYSLIGETLPSIEGYLFPETYKIAKGFSTKQIVQMMVEEFLTRYKDIVKPKNHHLSRHQVVTLASIVEKETGVGYERPTIASVFFNRLNKGMRLQSDPTILYGMLQKTKTIMPTNIRKRDIKARTPYNTYVVHGLPKGPIASPGIESIRAVLYPKKTAYLFFVSRNDGTHVFSRTYDRHKKFVDLYQRKRSKKSPN